MKQKIFLFAMLMIAAITQTKAQSLSPELETNQNYPTGYIKMDRAKSQTLYVQDGAVYAGNWLIKVEANSGQTFDIPTWVTRICDGAFSDAGITTLRFPSSWTESVMRQPAIYISPHAFDNSKIQHFEIYNDGSTSGMTRAKSDNNKKETARYDVSGKEISSAEPGINIIKYNDGSVSKVVSSDR